MVDIETVDKIANLARLEMDAQQKEKAAKSLADILDYVEELSKVDTSGVKPTAFAAADRDVLRDDEAVAELSQETRCKMRRAPKKVILPLRKCLVDERKKTEDIRNNLENM
jgi:aspartyl-tRNA(Asn)/glutamyl-tRNA(Gln) amidotransferase subunit C